MHPAPPPATALPPSSDPRWVVVSNLPREANDAWLRVFFTAIGSVEYVDFLGTDGPGSASVLFATVDQATAALRYDGYPAMGIALQVRPRKDTAIQSLASQMSSLLQNPQAHLPFSASSRSRPQQIHQLENKPTHKNLYVLNLPLDATTDQLTALFASYGTVVHCVILAMLDAQARRRGFIDMATALEAKEAIEGLNGFVWHGYPIEVSYAIVQRSGGPFDQDAGRNIIKRNVPRNRFNTGPRRVPSDSTVGSQLSSSGGLLSPPLYRDMASLGQLDSLSSSMFDESRADDDTATDPCTVFISGLDPVAILDDDDFRRMLEIYGNVTAASLSRDHEGISRGFGVVTYATEDEASSARDHLDGKLLNGRRLTSHNLVYNRSRRPTSGMARGTSTQVSFNLAHATTIEQAFSPSPFGSPYPLTVSIPTSHPSTSTTFQPVSAQPRQPSPLFSQNTTLPPGRLGSQQYSGQTSASWPSPMSPSFSPSSLMRRHDQIPMGAIGAKINDAAQIPLHSATPSLYRKPQMPNPTWFRSENSARPVEIKPDPREMKGNKQQEDESPTHRHSCSPLTRQLAAPFTPKDVQQPDGKSPSLLPYEKHDASPSSSRSAGTSMTLSSLETPSESLKTGDAVAIWGDSGASGAFSRSTSASPWTVAPSASSDGSTFHLARRQSDEGHAKTPTNATASGSALLALQEDASPYHYSDFDEKPRTTLAPVGHEKTSSPNKQK